MSKKTKVKNIQAYHEDAEEVIAGQRVALNLQGIEKNEITRGVIIGKPGTLFFTHRIDATLKYLKLPFKPIKNDSILTITHCNDAGRSEISRTEQGYHRPG